MKRNECCPSCGSDEVLYTPKRQEWRCDACGRRWQPERSPETAEYAGETAEGEAPAGEPGLEAQWPSALAVAWGEYRREEHPVQKLWAAAEFVETVARFAVMLRAGELAGAKGVLPQEAAARVADYVELPTLAKWRAAAGELVSAGEASVFAVELEPFLRGRLFPLIDGRKPRRERSPENSFLALRNFLAHGGALSKRAGARYLTLWSEAIETVAEALGWAAEITVAVRTDSGWVSLVGPGSEAVGLSAVERALAEAAGAPAAALRGERSIPLYPLLAYGPAVPPGAERMRQAGEAAPHMYMRREEGMLHYVALGHERAPVSVGTREAGEAFEALFRLGERREGRSRNLST